jgi:acyl dehydratase
MAGRYYEDLEVGAVMRHDMGRTVTETDNVLFTSLTMNTQPLHLDEHYAAQTEFGQRIVNGLFTLALVVGMSVGDLTQGTLIANLGYENVKHPRPVFHGDTIYVETTILSKRESESRPDAGVVTLKHVGMNQRGEIVVEVTRAALFKRHTHTPLSPLAWHGDEGELGTSE